MKSKILLVISLILALGTIYLCFRNIQLKKQLENYIPKVVSKIDTVYLDKPFKVEAPYKEVSSPTKVSVYKKGLEKDTSSQDKDSSSQSKDSVVQFKLDKSTLDLTLYNLSDSTVHTNKYHIDLDKYKYIYSNGVLTQKKKLNLKLYPYLQAKVRPINQFYDLSGGISLKTNNITYSIGVDLGYYPSFSDKLQKDVELSVTYNF